MEIINLNKDNFSKEPLAIALGYFDGVHLGHQAVILNAVRYSRKHQIKSAVLTFSINPKHFFNKVGSTDLLTPKEEKIKLFQQLGVDQLIILPFNKQLSRMMPDEFIKEYLIAQGVCYISTGFDFRFGRHGAGDVTVLKKYEEVFKLQTTPKLEFGKMKIGTTQIREYLTEGAVEKAAQMLGRPYSLTGKVVKGNQRGSEIGFPTANIRLDEDFVVPQKGVYAARVYVKNKVYNGMCNIGHNPTFNYSEAVSIEVNLLDFNEDIYGETVRVEFIKRLRSERRFQSIAELMDQLQSDREAVRNALG